MKRFVGYNLNLDLFIYRILLHLLIHSELVSFVCAKYIHYKYVPISSEGQKNENQTEIYCMQFYGFKLHLAAAVRLNGNISLITSMKAISIVFVELHSPSWTRNS